MAGLNMIVRLTTEQSQYYFALLNMKPHRLYKEPFRTQSSPWLYLFFEIIRYHPVIF